MDVDLLAEIEKAQNIIAGLEKDKSALENDIIRFNDICVKKTRALQAKLTTAEETETDLNNTIGFMQSGLDDRKSEVDGLQQQILELRGDCVAAIATKRVLAAAHEKIEELEAKLTTAVDAYEKHLNKCTIYRFSALGCTCGLPKALTELRKE